MSATDTADAAEPPRKSRVPLLIGVVLALALGGGGFYAAWSGLLPFGSGLDATGDEPPTPQAVEQDTGKGMPVFVPIEPMVVMLGQSAESRHLRFRAQLEVAPAAASSVSGQMPRILDVLNSYLRAVPVSEIESPAALVRLRAQMLRRIQLVTGEGAVRDLLVTEFVLN